MTVHSRPRVSLAELLPYAAQTTPEAIALITDEGSFTYSELDEKSNAVASALLDLGLERGQVVSLFGQNSMRWLTTYHGILKAGGVVNPINVMLSGPELSFVLSDCAAVGLFIGAAEAERIRSHLSQTGLEFMVTLDADWDRLVDEASNFEIPEVDRGPTELGSIGYTSGTTGHPKGAMQSLQSVLLNCAYTATMHGKVASDIVFSALPLAHVYGNVAVNGTLLAGGTVVLKERFDAVDVLKTIEAEKITVVEGVPAMYAMMLARHEVESTDFRSLRVSTVGGQTFSPIVIEKWESLTHAPLLELWGMTEVSGLGTTHSACAPSAPGSIGVSLPTMDLAIVPMDGSASTVPNGEPGELVVRGPLVMLGYFGNPEATTETIDSEGWLHTGDVATLDDTGHVRIVDRLKDVIFTGGYNVYPAEIERVIAEHEDVALVAVGRQPDEVKGEIAVAHIILREGATTTVEDILKFCADRLAAYKRPRRVYFRQSLPTTSSGKIMRRELGNPIVGDEQQ
ncbi:long-chain acyl-CoA synthetase [Brevibacterium siliguriense]|uniref:Long-chain acyl-CoA synthetase n=1 Tax=Brevibacterium siliguriense TaxID=1136497 RepID=A0A1H1X074_9MICO|nr:AMP-binding protein [Brevibacterium siliguriense]SDT02748.1 long-chain acyl-CoA synthetase [Brevibacterium siliguriense]